MAPLFLWAAPPASDGVETQFKSGLYEEIVAQSGAVAEGQLDYQHARLLGLSYFRLYDYSKAVPLLRRALTEHPGDPVTQISLAEILFNRNQTTQALALLESIPEPSPLYSDALILRGRIELSMGEDESALSTFESVKRHGIRLQGRATLESIPIYAQLGRYRDAEWQLRLALAADSHPITEAELKMQLRQLYAVRRQDEARRMMRGWVRYRLEHDDHLAGENSDPFAAGGGLSESDWRHLLQAGGNARTRLDSGWTLFGSADFYQSEHFKVENYDQQRFLIEAGGSRSLRNFGLRLPVRFHHMRLNNRFYQRAYEIQPTIFRNLDAVSFLSAYMRLKRREFQEASTAAEQRDGSYQALGLLYQHSFADERGLIYLSGELGDEDAEGNNWDSSFYQADTSLIYRYRPDLVFNASLRVIKQDFDNIHTLFGTARDDHGVTLNAKASYSLRREWAVTGGLSYTRHRSNIEFYDYNRTILYVGTEWDF